LDATAARSTKRYNIKAYEKYPLRLASKLASLLSWYAEASPNPPPASSKVKLRRNDPSVEGA